MFSFAYSGIAVIIFLLMGWLLQLPAPVAKSYVVENGPIEGLSVLGWFAAAFALAAVSRRAGWRDGYLGAWALCLAGFRELDFQKRFTTMGVSKIKFYLSPDVPATEKITVVVVLLLCLFPVFIFLKRNLPLLISQVRAKFAPALALVVTVALVVMSKMLDRLPNAIREEGYVFPVDLGMTLGVIEEVVELGLPCALIAVTFHYLHAFSARPEAARK